jgi:hypothetical protein
MRVIHLNNVNKEFTFTSFLCKIFFKITQIWLKFRIKKKLRMWVETLSI